MRRLFAAVLLLAPGAHAADTIYKWVDKNGEEHFTNDPSAIPPGQKTTTTEGAELGILHVREPGNAPADSVTRERPPRTRNAPARPPEEAPKQDDAEANELAWRGRFREARRHLAELEALVAQDQQRFDQVKDMSYSVTTTPLANGQVRQTTDAPADRAREQLQQDKKALEKAREELSDLERAASNQAIPRAWRE